MPSAVEARQRAVNPAERLITPRGECELAVVLTSADRDTSPDDPVRPARDRRWGGAGDGSVGRRRISHAPHGSIAVLTRTFLKPRARHVHEFGQAQSESARSSVRKGVKPVLSKIELN
jgi:hypothetical protein